MIVVLSSANKCRKTSTKHSFSSTFYNNCLFTIDWLLVSDQCQVCQVLDSAYRTLLTRSQYGHPSRRLDIAWWDEIMVEGSRQEILDLGFVLFSSLQKAVPVILSELVLADWFIHMSLSFTVKDVTTELSRP